MATIGSNIRRLRKTIGLNQSELARKLDVPPTRMNDWERGRYKQIEFSNLLRIAKALRVTLDDLLEGTDATYDAIISSRRDLIRHEAGLQSPTPARSQIKGGQSDATLVVASAHSFDRLVAELLHASTLFDRLARESAAWHKEAITWRDHISGLLADLAERRRQQTPVARAKSSRNAS